MNRAYHKMFKNGALTLGIFTPIESYSQDIPLMKNQDELIKKIEDYGFACLWVRDIPLRDPHFGDVGQMYDPFIYLSYLAAKTEKISLATASIILPFRHPINIAKSIQSVNNLSQGRLILGIATGDRPLEYEAHNVDFHNRGVVFRDTFSYLSTLLNENFPSIRSKLGTMFNADLLPKSAYEKVPLIVTGHSQQSINWIAGHSDGWIYYPSSLKVQEQRILQWKQETNQSFKPFIQSLYIDLAKDPNAIPIPIHLGYSLGRNNLINYLNNLKNIGVNHVILNIKYGKRPAEEVIDELGKYVIPCFNVDNQ